MQEVLPDAASSCHVSWASACREATAILLKLCVFLVIRVLHRQPIANEPVRPGPAAPTCSCARRHRDVSLPCSLCQKEGTRAWLTS